MAIYGKDCCAVCGRYCANDNYTKPKHYGVYCTESCLEKAIPKPKMTTKTKQQGGE